MLKLIAFKHPNSYACHRFTVTSDAPLRSPTPQRSSRRADLISDVLPFGRLWYTQVIDADDYAKFDSRSHDAVIRVYDDAGKVIETHEHKGEFKKVCL